MKLITPNLWTFKIFYMQSTHIHVHSACYMSKPLSLWSLTNLAGGHYISYARNSSNNSWYEYNDTRVRSVPSETVQQTEGYVLFYRRVPPPDSMAAQLVDPLTLVSRCTRNNKNIHSLHITLYSYIPTALPPPLPPPSHTYTLIGPS